VRTAKVTIESTGEIVEFDISSPEKMVESWAYASEYIKAYEKIKDKIKVLMPDHLDSRDMFEYKDYIMRMTYTQRKNYDKSVMREILNEDEFDLFLKPDAKKLKEYITEEIKNGDTRDWGALAKSMVDEGKPYTTLRLERLKHA
jgi:hypothetical protein